MTVMLALTLVFSSASSLAMGLFELTRRAVCTVTLFLASSTLFHSAGIISVRSQYLLGLGIGDITG